MSKLISKIFGTDGAELITLTEIKEHLYIETTNTDFDSILTSLRKEVREYVEEVTALSLVARTVTIYLDYDCPIGLPFGPVQTFSSASIKRGMDYEALTIDQDFIVENGRFISYAGTGEYKINYTGGYTTLPAGLKLAVLNEIASRFENRGDRGSPGPNDVLLPYKNVEWLI